MPQRSPSPDKIVEAKGLVGADIQNTLVLADPALDAAIGAHVLLKDESRGPIGSFKARGTDYLCARGVPAAVELVCASAGNFGQGMARSGKAAGHQVTVFAATTANLVKIARMRELGANVRLEGADFDAANEAAKVYAASRPGALFVEDCDFPEVAEGAGTIAREMTEAGLAFDEIYVPVGGGALAIGIGTWLRRARPRCRIIGVGAKGAPALHASWHAHRLIASPAVDTIADGIAIRVPLQPVMTQLASLLDDFVQASDAEMLAAMRLLNGIFGLKVEPSSATVVAAMLARKGRLPPAVAGVLTGGNLTVEQKAKWFS